jgi:hypothetical protein
MSKIYTVIFMNADMAMLDFKIYGNYTAALKEFLKQAILETKEKFAEEVSGSDDDSEFDVTSDSETEEDDEYEDDEDETTCVLQVHAPPEQSDGEFELKLEYDVESFQEFLSEKEDALEYMNQLEKDLGEPGFTLPDEIFQVFSSDAN